MGNGGYYIIRKFVIYTAHIVLIGSQIKKVTGYVAWMGGTRNAYRI
jgi:hypothetical protein